MSDVFDLKEYKKAKVLVKDLEACLKIINLTIRGLKSFKKYNPILEIINSLEINKSILEIHLQKYKRIINNKGNIEDDKTKV